MRGTPTVAALLCRGAAGLALAGLCQAALAALIQVGPGRTLTTIAQAARLAQDGDIVEIDAGEYRGDVAVWTQRRLTIVGVGGRAVLHADGRDAEGKAIWVIRDGDFRIRNIEFRGARVPDGNGAGIRFEGGRLDLFNCAFFDNQNGILAANNPEAVLSIENSIFGLAPHQASPLPHLLYAGAMAALSIRGSRFHGGYWGHLIKSRARRSDLRYNMIVDGAGGEASYEVDFPNGGEVTLVGNLIGKSASPQNPTMLSYGAEGYRWPTNRLALVHNTLVADGPMPVRFLHVFPPAPAAEAILTRNNLVAGLGLFTLQVEGDHAGNRYLPRAALGDPSLLDFSLPAGSVWRPWLAATQVEDPEFVPTAEFVLPLGTEPLAPAATRQVGALQRRSGVAPP
jgi:hypothetical protein